MFKLGGKAELKSVLVCTHADHWSLLHSSFHHHIWLNVLNTDQIKDIRDSNQTCIFSLQKLDMNGALLLYILTFSEASALMESVNYAYIDCVSTPDLWHAVNNDGKGLTLPEKLPCTLHSAPQTTTP